MVQMSRMCLTVFLLPFYPYNGLYNKRRDIGRKCIIFSPVVLPFVLQKFICKGVISVINRYLYRGFRGCPLTRLETHCDFRILQFLPERNKSVFIWRKCIYHDIIERLNKSET